MKGCQQILDRQGISATHESVRNIGVDAISTRYYSAKNAEKNRKRANEWKRMGIIILTPKLTKIF